MSAYRPGLFTALAAGVWVGHGIDRLSADATGIAGLGVAALADVAAGHAAIPTQTEIIITTTIVENNRFLMRRSDVYYVPDADARLYSKTTAVSSECAGTSQHVSEIDQEKEVLAERMSGMLKRYPDWRGTIYSDKDFGMDGPVFVRR